MRRLWTVHKGGQSRPPLQNPAARPPVGAAVPTHRQPSPVGADVPAALRTAGQPPVGADDSVGPRPAALVGPHTAAPGGPTHRQPPPVGADDSVGPPTTAPGGPLAAAPRTGLRLRFQPGVDPEVRAACIRFAAWLRRTYVFPVRVPVYVKAAATVTCRDGEEASAVFFGPDDPAQEPYIRLSAGDYPALRQRWGRDGALGGILHSLAHELSHYFQWLNHHDAWLLDDPETDRRLERQAVYYADAILNDYAETVDHP